MTYYHKNFISRKAFHDIVQPHRVVILNPSNQNINSNVPTLSKLPNQSIIEDNVDDIQIATDMESLLTNTQNFTNLLSVDASIASTSSALALSTLDASSCWKWSETTEAKSLIKCSKCLLFIHFRCNEGGVTSYYKKKFKIL